MSPAYLATVGDFVRSHSKFVLLLLGGAAFMVWNAAEYIVVPAWFHRKIHGPTLAGIARAVPVKETPSKGPDDDIPWYLLELRVHVPGREPYNLPVRRRFFLWARPAEGDEWPVQVAATNPHRVRIDFSQPLKPHAESND